MPQITVEKLWSASYQPWLASSYPWSLVGIHDDIVLSLSDPEIRYGYVVQVDAQNLTISVTDVIVPQDAVFPDSQSISVTLSSPQVIATIGQWLIENESAPVNWNQVIPPSSSWVVETESFNSNWSYAGKTWLWGELNKPWLSTYYPWQETNGQTALYNEVNKPITNWS